MLNKNSVKVLSYLTNYFRNNKNPITIFDIEIDSLSLAQIESAFEELSKKGFIKLNEEYIYPCIDKVMKI